MSVIKSKRSTSDMEFLATARKLEIYTIQKCVNFPKRYTFYVSQPLAAAATRIYEDVKRGNSIYPLNQHEVQIRRDYFLHANAELQSMISQLEVAQLCRAIQRTAHRSKHGRTVHQPFYKQQGGLLWSTSKSCLLTARSKA